MKKDMLQAGIDVIVPDKADRELVAKRIFEELDFVNEFDVITAIQVNHYMNETGRRAALMKYYAALKNNGLFISFENFAPFTDLGNKIKIHTTERKAIV
ncbi:MAG: hypothetical protein E7299_02455 [Lachnospiraceae bacterium]|nr:hypothetical protein [Lachnospiraceae bacterium]